jgi:diguanylate cyclase (GGDEF)-like protein
MNSFEGVLMRRPALTSDSVQKYLPPIAAISLLLFLLGLALHSAWSLAENRHALEQAKLSMRVSQNYDEAEKATVTAQLAATKFLIAPNRNDREAFDQAILRALEALRFVRDNGTPHDRHVVDTLFAQHLQGIDAAHNLFDSVEQGIPPESNDESSLVGEITALLRQESALTRQSADEVLSKYGEFQNRQNAFSLAVFATGVPLVLLLLFMARHYERVFMKAQMELLRDASLKDSLTGLGNHGAFFDKLEELCLKARNDNTPLILAIMDFDLFKLINDRTGHSKGDQLLKDFAQLLQQNLRDPLLTFRIGGDEFAAIVPGETLAQATVRFEQLRLEASTRLAPLTISIGMADFAIEPANYLALRERADEALYRAKDNGGNFIFSRLNPEGILNRL